MSIQAIAIIVVVAMLVLALGYLFYEVKQAAENPWDDDE